MKAYPEAYTGGIACITARLLHDELTCDARLALFLIWGAVGFVLLIAGVKQICSSAKGRCGNASWRWGRVLGVERMRIAR